MSDGRRRLREGRYEREEENGYMHVRPGRKTTVDPSERRGKRFERRSKTRSVNSISETTDTFQKYYRARGINWWNNNADELVQHCAECDAEIIYGDGSLSAHGNMTCKPCMSDIINELVQACVVAKDSGMIHTFERSQLTEMRDAIEWHTHTQGTLPELRDAHLAEFAMQGYATRDDVDAAHATELDRGRERDLGGRGARRGSGMLTVDSAAGSRPGSRSRSRSRSREPSREPSPASSPRSNGTAGGGAERPGVVSEQALQAQQRSSEMDEAVVEDLLTLDTETLLDALEDPQFKHIRECVLVLGDRRDEATLPALGELALHAKDTLLREEAVHAVSSIPSPNTLLVLVRAMDDVTFHVRVAALKALAEMLDQGTLDSVQINACFATVLYHEDANLREAVVKCAKLTRNVTLLDHCTRDPESKVRAAAVRALVDVLKGVDLYERGFMHVMLSLQAVLQADDDVEVRMEAVLAMEDVLKLYEAETGNVLSVGECMPLIIATRKEKNAEVRVAALQTLEELGMAKHARAFGPATPDGASGAGPDAEEASPPRGGSRGGGGGVGGVGGVGGGGSRGGGGGDGVDELIETYRSMWDDEDGRVAIVMDMAELQHPACLDTLIEALDAGGKSLQIAAAHALARFPDHRARAIPSLVRTMLYNTHAVREAAVDALLVLGDDSCVEALAKMIKTSRDRAAKVLACSVLGAVATPLAEDTLVAALEDKDIKVREAAMVNLGKVGNPALAELLTEQMEREDDPIAKTIARESLNSLNWSQFLEGDEQIVVHSFVMLQLRMISCKRQLILTDKPRLLLVNIKNNEVHICVEWNEHIVATQESKTTMVELVTGEKSHYNVEVGTLEDAQLWVAEINRTTDEWKVSEGLNKVPHLAQLSARRRDRGVDRRGSDDSNSASSARSSARTASSRMSTARSSIGDPEPVTSPGPRSSPVTSVRRRNSVETTRSLHSEDSLIFSSDDEDYVGTGDIDLDRLDREAAEEDDMDKRRRQHADVGVPAAWRDMEDVEVPAVSNQDIEMRAKQIRMKTPTFGAGPRSARGRRESPVPITGGERRGSRGRTPVRQSPSALDGELEEDRMRAGRVARRPSATRTPVRARDRDGDDNSIGSSAAGDDDDVAVVRPRPRSARRPSGARTPVRGGEDGGGGAGGAGTGDDSEEDEFAVVARGRRARRASASRARLRNAVSSDEDEGPNERSALRARMQSRSMQVVGRRGSNTPVRATAVPRGALADWGDDDGRSRRSGSRNVRREPANPLDSAR